MASFRRGKSAYRGFAKQRPKRVAIRHRFAFSTKLSFEALEDRLPLAVFTVTTAADTVNGSDGVLSLREAIATANGSPGLDEIHFNISGTPTINLTSGLPTLTGPTEIRGDTQPGFVGTPIVELNGIGAGSTRALEFTASGNTVRGLVINRFQGDGIRFNLSSSNTIAGNYIGTDVTGNIARGNLGDGIFIFGGANNTIGGTAAQDRNVISASVGFGGIFVTESTGVQIKGNYIGIAANGIGDLGNQLEGIAFDRVGNSTIGGTDPASRNIISGNGTNGVVIFGAASINNAVQGNYIGTNAAGDAGIANDVAGVLLTRIINAPTETASFNVIGGAEPGAGNVISGNTRNGIEIFSGAHHNRIEGNFIGTTADGMNDLGNGGGGADPNGGFGIDITEAPDNIVGGDDDDDGTSDGAVRAQNVISGNARGGVRIDRAGTSGNQVAGNLIGLNVSGTAALANDGPGVLIDTASDNTIGGTTAGSGNTISGNEVGIEFVDGANENRVWGNRIGTNPAGTAAIANQGDGILIDASFNNEIGDFTATVGAMPGNLISGNVGNGIRVLDTTAALNRIYGNIIGLNAAGTAKLANEGHGIIVEFAPSNTIGATSVGGMHARNIISGNLLDGVRIASVDASGNHVVANWIGVSASGAEALGNTGSGVSINHAPGNVVELGNVISGNQSSGVEIFGSAADDNEVKGSIIGLDVSGAGALGNQGYGILIQDGSDNQIGGVATPAGSGVGNVISDNGESGVLIIGLEASDNKIQGNLIGTASDGTTDRGNKKYGVGVVDGNDNMIGGANAGEGNTIAFNGAVLNVSGHGVVISSGTGNTIRRNSIHSNLGRGIDLGSDSFTINDPGDLDGGANHLQNFPFVRAVQFGISGKSITFNLHTSPPAPSLPFVWEFYSNTDVDPSGFGDGQTFLFSELVPVDATGFATVTKTFALTDTFISVTVTDPLGNTSEFSMVDTDGDALADAWEISGIDVDEDGFTDFFLAGANPNKKDIYVEVDAMAGFNPDPLALDDVAAAFASAPASSVQNPDLSGGIALHWFNGGDWDIFAQPWKELADEDGLPFLFGPTKEVVFGTPSERVLPNWDQIRAARLLTTRYCLFIDQISDKQSRQGQVEEIPSNDFYVALGSPLFATLFENRDAVAGVFMHELGHSLGLGHGGGDHEQYKPNYFSVMNYIWTTPLPGFASSWVLDYSRQQTATINENNINELAGLGGTPGRFVPIGQYGDPHALTFTPVRLAPQAGGFDFDQDGVIQSTSSPTDLNFLVVVDALGEVGFPITMFTELHGYDDWSNLQYGLNGSGLRHFADGMSADIHLMLSSIGSGPGLVQFAAPTLEAEEDSGLATISVVRTGGTSGPVSVQYRTILGGSAGAGTDYTTVNGTINFADGEFRKVFTIPIVSDVALEGTETVQLELFNPSGTSLGAMSMSTLEITEPMTVEFVETSLSVDESAGMLAIDVSLAGETGQTLAEDIVVRIKDLLTGSAVAGVDYLLPAATSLMFSAGSAVGATQTIMLEIIDHFVVDPPRTVELALRQIDSYFAVANPTPLTITIVEEGEPVRLVKDLAEGAPHGIDFESNPSFAGFDGKLYFTINDGTHGFELWTSNGTATGTVQLVDIRPGPLSSNPAAMIAVGETMYFVADDGVAGSELWKSDGTVSGTEMVKDIRPGSNASFPIGLTNVGGVLYFTADDGVHGRELWRSDGTPAGTFMVADLNSNLLANFAGVGDTLYFLATMPGLGQELWKSDGTSGGTMLVKDIVTGPNGSIPSNLLDAGGTLYFTTLGGGSPRLWKSNGTDAGTVMLHGNVDSLRPANIGGTVYFSADDGTNGYELWKTNGTVASTMLVANIAPGSDGSFPQNLTNVGGMLFFSASDAARGHELWKSNGMAGGTTLVKDVQPGTESSVLSRFTDVDGTLYFTADDGTHGVELWESNGAAVGTTMLSDIAAGPEGSLPLDLTVVGSGLFFHADDLIHGRELWGVPPPVAAVVGDYNGDQNVNAADYTIWRDTLGAVVPPLSGADGDGDGSIDAGDYDIWKANFGNTPGPGSGAIAVDAASASFVESADGAALDLSASGVSTSEPSGPQQLWSTLGVFSDTRASLPVKSSVMRPDSDAGAFIVEQRQQEHNLMAARLAAFAADPVADWVEGGGLDLKALEDRPTERLAESVDEVFARMLGASQI